MERIAEIARPAINGKMTPAGTGGEELVIRDTHIEDRRYITIALTPKGQQVFESIESNMELYYGIIFKTIPQDERALVIEGLELLTDAVKENKGC